MKRTSRYILACAAFWMLPVLSCRSTHENTSQTGVADAVRVTTSRFGETPDGALIQRYTLTNKHGITVVIINYGAIVVSLQAPDRQGRLADIVLGYDTLAEYIADESYFGAVVGRYGNRIARGQFELERVTYTLATNNGPNHLHGGNKGFNKVIWQGEPLSRSNEAGVKLTYLSRSGEEGYPGNLHVTVKYWLTEGNELRIEYQAATDKATPVNLTHHSYFNLAGHDSGSVLDHELMINAARFCPVDSVLIPTGQLQGVAGTPLDFNTPTTIGARIEQPDPQLQYAGGYDHNWVLNRSTGELTLAARVREPTSGRVMEVYTTEPGLQFYSGNFLDGTIKGKGGSVYNHRGGFCLEAQHFPDSPNQPNFPSTILTPGSRYQQTTIYKFTVE